MTPYDLPDYHALIRHIRDVDRAGGDSTLARKVVADWLEEHGEEERAEFVRIGCEVADCAPCTCLPATIRSPSYTWCDGCRDRAAIRDGCACYLRGPKPHLYENEVVWFHDGSGTDTLRMVMRPEWDRGWVASVRCELSRWLTHGPDICRRHPVRKVVITGLTTDRANHIDSHQVRRFTTMVRKDFPCISDEMAAEAELISEDDLIRDEVTPIVTLTNKYALRWAEAEADRQHV